MEDKQKNNRLYGDYWEPKSRAEEDVHLRPFEKWTLLPWESFRIKTCPGRVNPGTSHLRHLWGRASCCGRVISILAASLRKNKSA